MWKVSYPGKVKETKTKDRNQEKGETAERFIP